MLIWPLFLWPLPPCFSGSSAWLFSLIFGLPTLVFPTFPFPKLIACNECLRSYAMHQDFSGVIQISEKSAPLQQIIEIRNRWISMQAVRTLVEANTQLLQACLTLNWCYCCHLCHPHPPALSVSVMSRWASSGDASKHPDASLQKKKKKGSGMKTKMFICSHAPQ